MRTQHLPFAIEVQARELWLAQPLLALDEDRFPNEARLKLWNGSGPCRYA
jgi:hypothetical protein